MTNKSLPIFTISLILGAFLLFAGYWYYRSITPSITIRPNRNLLWRDFNLVKEINNRPGINARCITYIVPTIKNVKNRDGRTYIIPDVDVGIEEELTQVSGSFLAKADQNKKQIVLNHENGHFKIAQIIGHKILRQTEAFDFHPTNYQQEFDSLVKANFLEWRQLDRQYDQETTNPRDLDKQREWDRFFRITLNAYKN